MEKLTHEEISASFSALGHKSRVAILFELLTRSNSGSRFGEIRKSCKIPASTLSHHLSEMENGGIIERIPEGRATLFRPKIEHLSKILGALMAQCCKEEKENLQ